jgi:signal transduction histidine kinase
LGTRAYEYIFVPLFGADNTVEGVAGITRDITERKCIEVEREQILHRTQIARRAAEETNRIKDEFLAVLSHELRTPLNPILGWSKLLQSRKLNEVRTTQALETIERNARLQSQLIEDLLDVSRILRGKLTLNVAPVALKPMLESAIETVQLAAEAKNIEMETVFAPDVSPVSGDQGRLQQVVWNLLSNSVKFTPDGGRVEIRLTQKDRQAQIEVRDTGKGISPDFLPYVFEHFRQEDGAITRKFGGLGLGLAIARQIVELHGGTIAADSAGEGLGTTFTVRLPSMHVNSAIMVPAAQTVSSTVLTGLRVLVVDDETDARALVQFILEQEGAIVTGAASAPEALQVLRESTC